MENHQRNQATTEKRYHNVRVRKEIFDIIGQHCYAEDKSLARAIEDALERYIEEEGLTAGYSGSTA